MGIDVNNFLDDRNAPIWNVVSQSFQIEVAPSLTNEYSCYSKNGEATIYVDTENICIAYFTHELLHLYLKVKGVFIGAGFSNQVAASRTLSRIFSEALLDHVGNCLDHIKMFEIYDALGFEKTKFILDFDTHKCLSSELSDLKKNYKKGNQYNTAAVDFYIGKFIGIHADFNDDLDYDNCLSELKKLDPVLYNVLENFIIEWEEFDIESTDLLKSSYHMVLHRFYENLKFWLGRKQFV